MSLVSRRPASRRQKRRPQDLPPRRNGLQRGLATIIISPSTHGRTSWRPSSSGAAFFLRENGIPTARRATMCRACRTPTACTTANRPRFSPKSSPTTNTPACGASVGPTANCPTWSTSPAPKTQPWFSFARTGLSARAPRHCIGSVPRGPQLSLRGRPVGWVGLNSTKVFAEFPRRGVTAKQHNKQRTRRWVPFVRFCL